MVIFLPNRSPYSLVIHMIMFNENKKAFYLKHLELYYKFFFFKTLIRFLFPECFQAFRCTGLSRARRAHSSPSERAWARGQHLHRHPRNKRADPPTTTTTSQDRCVTLIRGTEPNGARVIRTKTKSAFIIATWTSSGSTRLSECPLFLPITFFFFLSERIILCTDLEALKMSRNFGKSFFMLFNNNKKR